MPSFPTINVGSGWNQSTGIGEIEFALKHFYLPGMEEQKNNARVLLANIQRNEKDVSGDYAFVPIMLGRNWGLGMRRDRQALPDAGYQRGVRAQVKMKYSFGQLIVTLHAMAATRNSQGSYETVLDVETDGLMEDLPKDINRQLFGNGSGGLAEVASAAGQVITVNNNDLTNGTPHVAGEFTKYIEVGQRIDSVTPAGVVHDAGMVVSAVTPTTVTMAAGVTAATVVDDLLVLSGNGPLAGVELSNELTGLQAAISATNTYQGVNRATSGNERWQANVITNPGAAFAVDITEDVLQQADTAAQKASGMIPNLIVGTYELRDKYASILQQGRRFVNTIAYKGGFTGPEFSGRGIVPDPDCPRGKTFFLNTDFISLYQQAGLQFMNEDGAVLSRKSGFAAYEATLYWFFEMGMRRSNVHTLITHYQQ